MRKYRTVTPFRRDLDDVRVDDLWGFSFEHVTGIHMPSGKEYHVSGKMHRTRGGFLLFDEKLPCGQVRRVCVDVNDVEAVYLGPATPCSGICCLDVSGGDR